MKHWLLLVIILAMACFRLASEDAKLAEGFAVGGADLIAKNKIEKGQQLLYQALAYDNNCVIALYELGKQFEEEGNLVLAADFLTRAVVEFAKNEKSNSSYNAKRADATRRLQKLNPCAMQFSLLLEYYGQDLIRINKKVPDSLTTDEIGIRIEQLKLASILPKDKFPSVPQPIVKSADSRNPKTDNNISPDVERALKGAGWTTILGAWTKKADNVYEVTNGKLEATKLNGSIQLFVHKGNIGTVFAFVRATKSHLKRIPGELLYKRELGKGYGVMIGGQDCKGPNCKLFMPTQRMDGSYSPYMEHSFLLPETNAKNYVMVTVQDSKLEIFVNAKKERSANYLITKEGTFLITIEGTATIENPTAIGK
ncbi:MAG: hypothetical protein V1899_00495 [Planctomycetota bacterium]